MFRAAVTMNQLQKKIDIIGNNLANSETTGYKSRDANFSSLLFQQIDHMTAPANREGRLTQEGLRIGSGAKLGAINNNNTPGSITETDRVLDTALLKANHLFPIQVNENGTSETRFTRDGAFYLNPVNHNQDVMLTTKTGDPVLGENGPIVFDKEFDAITIQSTGDIILKRGNQTEQVGRIAVVEAARPQLLEAAGGNTFRLAAGQNQDNIDEIISPQEANVSVLKSNALENSNVDMSKQMSDLLMAQRSYQLNARTISMSDQMSGLINQLR
ncbi:flagellar hook-basal body protein [Virgibacillus alimentarius]|uniref:flagellar hook-basal body protein n=1 Tax=Virgibacillus alimentarius TaxID=698769 RepID=UPI00049387FA|nr:MULTISPECIES: flagellar hook-basal body protein [Virgibacillus]HLR67741.1 flagellar hook-basal body protein [Virgibacillus sp.]